MKLVFIHGIWNYPNIFNNIDENIIKNEICKKWIDSLKKGISNCNDLTLDPNKIDLVEIELVYYGDLYKEYGTLISTIDGGENSAQVLAKEIALAIDPNKVGEIEKNVYPSGIVNYVFKELVKVIQNKIPWIDEMFLTIFAQEGSLYFDNKVYSSKISEKFFNTFPVDEKVVIVGHSLGSVIAYDLLVNNSKKINKLITLGSPLAVGFFNKKLKKKHIIEMPKAIENSNWINMVGIEDFVSLYPLNEKYFYTIPNIINLLVKTKNNSPHDVTGYLENAKVALEIYKSLDL